MQGLVRGWIIRRKRKRAQHRIDVSHKTVFAVRLQRWWRRYLFRTYVSALRKERLAKCRIDICRIIRWVAMDIRCEMNFSQDLDT